MTKKKKDYIPKNMKDLEAIFYGSNKDDKNVDFHRQRRYLDWLKSQIMSPAFEDNVKDLFSAFGKIEKIPESQKHSTFDFKIDTRKMLIEVTSLNINESARAEEGIPRTKP